MSVDDEEPRRGWAAPRLSRRALLAANARQGELRHAVRVSAAVGAAFAVGALLHLPQAYWAVFTAVLVVQTSIGGTITATVERLIGTVVGGLAGVLGAYVRAQTVLEEGLVLSAVIALLAFGAAIRPSLRVAPITAAIVLIGGSSHMAPLAAAAWRVVEILIGSVIGLGATLLVFPARARKSVTRRVSETMSDLAGLMELHAHRLEGREVRAALHDAHVAIRKSLIGVEQALAEAARESASGFGDAEVPEGLLDSLLRARTDSVMVARALAQPLPPLVAEVLAPRAQALLRAAADELRDGAQAVQQGTTLDHAALAQPRAAFEEAVERMRQSRVTSDMTFDTAARVYGLVFALESLADNLAGLTERIDEMASPARAAASKAQAAPAVAP